MWRWYAGCTEQEKRGAEDVLNDMQKFLEEHSGEVKSGAYTGHVKATCYYARTRNPIVFDLLYSMNTLYRSKNRNKYFGQ
jgi:hypothetical protein